MKNPQFDAAKEFIGRATGHQPIGDEDLHTLIKVILQNKAAAYEVDDFVYFRMGMGEAGHGKVVALDGKDYRVDVWYPPELRETEKPWVTYVGHGDVIGLSNETEAQEYWTERSK